MTEKVVTRIVYGIPISHEQMGSLLNIGDMQEFEVLRHGATAKPSYVLCRKSPQHTLQPGCAAEISELCIHIKGASGAFMDFCKNCEIYKPAETFPVWLAIITIENCES